MSGSVRVELTPAELPVQPGGAPVTAALVVSNDGLLVDEIGLQVGGLDPAWYTLSEPSVRLLPGSTAVVYLEVRIPAAATAGRLSVGVLARSRIVPADFAEAAFSLDVATVGSLALELSPQRVTSRQRARFVVQAINTTNAEQRVLFALTDPNAALRYELDSAERVVPPNETVQVGLWVQPRERKIIGPRAEYPFTVQALDVQDPAAAPVAETTGTLVRAPLVPVLPLSAAALRRWGPLALPLLLVLAILAWVFGAPGRPSAPIVVSATPTLAVVAAPAPKPAEPAPAPVPTDEPVPVEEAVLEPPVIAHFGLNLALREQPLQAPLAYDVSGATALRIERTGGDRGPARDLQALESTSYTLYASNEDGETSQSMTLYILWPPQIRTFEASAVQVGGNTVVTWNAERAGRVTLNGQVLSSASGVLEVPYDPAAQYVLRAENAAGSDERQVQVIAGSPPVEVLGVQVEPTSPPSPTPTGTPTLAPSVAPTPIPAVEPSASPTATTAPPPSPTLTNTVPPTSTSTSTPLPSATPTASPTATSTPCPALGNPTLAANRTGNGVSVTWSAVGGCGPFSGSIIATYGYANRTSDHSIGNLSGGISDTPPPPPTCGRSYPVSYRLTLRDRTGQSVSSESSSSVSRPCPAVVNPPTLTVTADGGGSIRAFFGDVPIQWPASGGTTIEECTSTCSVVLPADTAVRLVATPAPTTIFTTWDNCVSAVNTCGLVVTSGTAPVTAHFRQPRLAVTVAGSGGGVGGTVNGTPITWPTVGGPTCLTTCMVDVPRDSAVVLTAVDNVDNGVVFSEWQQPGVPSVTTPALALTMTGDLSPVAMFNWLVNVSLPGFGSGRILSTPPGLDCFPVFEVENSAPLVMGAFLPALQPAPPGPVCRAGFPPNSTLSLTITPDPGSHLAALTGCSTASVLPTSQLVSCTSIVAPNLPVSATFAPNPSVRISLVGDGEVTSAPVGIDCFRESEGPRAVCEARFPPEVPVVLTARPFSGSFLDRWENCPTPPGVPAPPTTARSVCTLPVPVTGAGITAVFHTPVLQVDASPGGSISGTADGFPIDWAAETANCTGRCSIVLPVGTLVTLTASPASSFTGWTGCEAPVGPTCSLTITTSDVAVVATFVSGSPTPFFAARVSAPAATASPSPATLTPVATPIPTVAAEPTLLSTPAPMPTVSVTPEPTALPTPAPSPSVMPTVDPSVTPSPPATSVTPSPSPAIATATATPT